jgi:hypothetical protein
MYFESTQCLGGTNRARQRFVVTLLLAVLASGCSKNDPVGNQNVDESLAVPAASAVADVQQMVTSDATMDDVEAPLSSAAGDVESLGDVGAGSDDLGEYGRVTTLLESAVDGLVQSMALGQGARTARAAIAPALGTLGLAASESCATTPQPDGGTLEVCIATTDTVDVVRVTITRTSPVGPVTRSELLLYVNTNGTAVTGDDRILAFRSRIELLGGTAIELSMTPQSGSYIVDGATVDLVERILPARGPMVEQRNAMTLQVGDVETDGDETILSLSAQVSFRNGSMASLAVTDSDPADGFADEDTLAVVSSFTAAPANSRLQAITSTIVVLVHQLEEADDDQVASLRRETVFDGQTAGGGSPTSVVVFTPSAPVGGGEEPCGGRFERHATFPAGWDARSLDLVITRNCGGGGSSVLDVVFADGTSLHREITWDGAGNATLDATLRDGTQVTGTWNRSTRQFVLDAVYPTGNDPVSSHLEGSSDPEARTRTLLLTRTHTDASVDSVYMQSAANGDTTVSVTGYAVDSRGRVDYQMTIDGRDGGSIVGSAWGPDDETLDFSIVPLTEEEGWLLTFTYRDPSAFLTVTGSIVLDGDGSGCGTITVTILGQSEDVPVCFGNDGGGSIANTIPF